MLHSRSQSSYREAKAPTEKQKLSPRSYDSPDLAFNKAFARKGGTEEI